MDNQGIRYITLGEVEKVHPVSRSTRWRMIKAGKFPQPVRISQGRIAWCAEEIEHWCRANLDLQRQRRSVL